MNDEEFKRIYKSAKSFAVQKRGLSDQEAEDFAQECCIKTFQKGPIRIDWEFDVVETDCDGERMTLRYRDGESYDAWVFDDFEFFALLEGEMPTAEIE
jgi:hypothetical protein